METLKQYAYDLFQISLNQNQIDAFVIYMQDLMEWNSIHNLTAIRDKEKIITKHFLDSLSCYSIVKNKPPRRLIDIGTGAGFPGIPLKILFPQMQLTLVESVGKKTRFCEHIAGKLNLSNVQVIKARAEDLGQSDEHREQYDWAVARAVAAMPVLMEFLLPFVSVSGAVLAQKGETGPAEAQAAEKAIQVLGGHIRQLHKVTLPGVVEDRYLIYIDKIASTPPQFPRRVGIPAKSPL
ncbi:MAG: 16S rRNA (guanine(527)-N(7))-methyltransferase RsmG [Anaerolineaceae bacterium]|nr:16S rRNA (guanine(527)-N(7))-methyltransferase RsmG [Anaerolineaceae bacterium]